MSLPDISTFKLKFGIRELFYVCLCVVLGYLLRVRDSYSLNPVWRKRSETSKFANSKFPTDADHSPSPIITDLEGDGVNEIVLVSNDLLHLNILAMPSDLEREDRSLAHVVVKHKTEIILEERVKGHSPKPYVVDVGFTMPYLSMMQIRKQIIVVVTDDWQVICYNPDLTLRWHQNLPLPTQDMNAVEVKYLGILVSPFSIEKNHEGLVILSGNFRHKSHKLDPYAEIKAREASGSVNRTLEAPATGLELSNETLTQFSTFALSAKDGSVLWKHVSGDFEDSGKNAGSELHWKLSLKHKKARQGESHWSDFGNQLDSFFPHLWADNGDTEITLARINKEFDRQEQKGAAATTPASTSSPALLPEHLIGFSYGGQRPHSAHEHINNPNSVVIRSPKGLEILSLVTGQAKTAYTVPADRSIYLDMDGDGHLEKMVWDQGEHYSPCFLNIWRVSPVQEKLDQIALCTNKRLFWVNSWSLEEDIYKKIPPKLIKSKARKTGILRHFLGHNLFGEETYDIITFGGMGRITSFGMDGSIHWQTATESKWGDLSMGLRRSGGSRHISDNVKEEFLLSFQPSRILMPLVVAGPVAAVAVTGLNSISVVDLVEGNVLAEHSLPAASTAPLIYGDFDNDGIMDLIVTCKKGYIGFSMKLKHNYEMTLLYTVAVFLIIILFSWLISTTTQRDEDDESDFVDNDNEHGIILGGDDNISENSLYNS